MDMKYVYDACMSRMKSNEIDRDIPICIIHTCNILSYYIINDHMLQTTFMRSVTVFECNMFIVYTYL